MMHVLIVGARGVGKSTLIRRVLEELSRPIAGFETKKETALADPVLGNPIYLYPAGLPHQQTPENLVGYCKNKHFSSMAEVFDRFAPQLCRPLTREHIVVLDELGFMESQATAFCNAVFSLLDGEIPVLAAVKDKDVPFLNAVRAHANCRCFFITAENRDELFPQVLAFLREQYQKET